LEVFKSVCQHHNPYPVFEEREPLSQAGLMGSSSLSCGNPELPFWLSRGYPELLRPGENNACCNLTGR
jgi:hypothetical protein